MKTTNELENHYWDAIEKEKRILEGHLQLIELRQRELDKRWFVRIFGSCESFSLRLDKIEALAKISGLIDAQKLFYKSLRDD